MNIMVILYPLSKKISFSIGPILKKELQWRFKFYAKNRIAIVFGQKEGIK